MPPETPEEPQLTSKPPLFITAAERLLAACNIAAPASIVKILAAHQQRLNEAYNGPLEQDPQNFGNFWLFSQLGSYLPASSRLLIVPSTVEPVFNALLMSILKGQTAKVDTPRGISRQTATLSWPSSDQASGPIFSFPSKIRGF